MSTAESKLAAAFRTALSVPADVPVETLAYREWKTWDSMAHMQLISELENAFDIMIDTDDVIAMSNYAKAREIVAKYGVQF